MIDSGSKKYNWRRFRAALALRREALAEEDLSRLWKEMNNEWLPPSPKHADAIDYLQKSIRPLRSKWSLAFLANELTFGASSTQRAESWNSLVKSTNISSSLTHLAKHLSQFVQEQGALERKSRDSSVRQASLIRMNMHDWESISSLMSTMGISRFACSEVATELFHAVRISIQSIQCTTDTFRSNPGQTCAGIAKYAWEDGKKS